MSRFILLKFCLYLNGFKIVIHTFLCFQINVKSHHFVCEDYSIHVPLNPWCIWPWLSWTHIQIPNHFRINFEFNLRRQNFRQTERKSKLNFTFIINLWKYGTKSIRNGKRCAIDSVLCKSSLKEIRKPIIFLKYMLCIFSHH